MEAGMLAGWYDVCMYNISLSTLRKFYITLMTIIVRQECSRLLPFPSPKILNYT